MIFKASILIPVVILLQVVCDAVHDLEFSGTLLAGVDEVDTEKFETFEALVASALEEGDELSSAATSAAVVDDDCTMRKAVEQQKKSKSVSTLKQKPSLDTTPAAASPHSLINTFLNTRLMLQNSNNKAEGQLYLDADERFFKDFVILYYKNPDATLDNVLLPEEFEQLHYAIEFINMFGAAGTSGEDDAISLESDLLTFVSYFKYAIKNYNAWRQTFTTIRKSKGIRSFEDSCEQESVSYQNVYNCFFKVLLPAASTSKRAPALGGRPRKKQRVAHLRQHKLISSSLFSLLSTLNSLRVDTTYEKVWTLLVTRHVMANSVTKFSKHQQISDIIHAYHDKHF